MSFLRLPESFGLLHWLAKLWWLYSGVIKDCADWLSWTQRHLHCTYYADLIEKVRATLKEKIRGKLHRRVLFHQDNAPGQLKHWLPSKRPAFNYCTTHCICQTWLQVNSICFLNWRNSWKDTNFLILLITRTLSAWQTADWKAKTNDSSAAESELWRNAGPSAFLLQEIVFKGTKYNVCILWFNCVRQWTLWTTLVHYIRLHYIT